MARGGRRDSFPAGCFLLLSDHPACRDSPQRQPGEPLCNFSTPNQALCPPLKIPVPARQGPSGNLGLSSAGPTCIQTGLYDPKSQPLCSSGLRDSAFPQLLSLWCLTMLDRSLLVTMLGNHLAWLWVERKLYWCPILQDGKWRNFEMITSKLITFQGEDKQQNTQYTSLLPC